MIVAIDTGGTKTLIASFGEDGILGQQIKFATPADPNQYIEAVRQVLIDNFSNQRIDAIVIAIPGVIKDDIVTWCSNLPWENFDVVASLQGVLGKVPILIENDAKLAGLSETRFLDRIPKQSLYVTISTGIGTGIITEGHIDPDLRNSEGGHALIEFDGKLLEWEKFASGKAIFNTYGKYAHDIKDKKTWDQIADRISRGFLAIIPLLQPDVIIIGGSIGTYFEEYDNQLQKILRKKLPKHISCPLFVQARYPELAVIYGCYYYAIDYFSDRKR
jgi:predicted NBD/HSP70 family sugar kinase